ncbi:MULTISPECIES: chloride channel protein [Xanthomonas]|uniref:chloride channel protein n=1 Tax=Xanthomonas TaxID=338 RepID=UPI001ADCE04D|nr:MULTISPECIES: chloride channel protein [unclassified Xanthomonas]MBO9874476.1 chloride channel protein [Xanthomonas sp. D-93]WNH47013.1 chloride channel protein [Xanthomonas sp. A6251]
MPRRFAPLDRRVLRLCALALLVGALVALAAHVLIALIALATNLAYYGRWSIEAASPAGHHLGAWAIGLPVVGGLIVGAMARWGSRAIRGHGIPEAMEQILRNESRIPPRMIWLKPLSSAVAIGTGGPFGAEGPIIATGGALGSLFGQWLRVTADERKVLLAAGAAAGTAAVFAAPISAVLLAIELLLFEWRARSLTPVALAAAVGAGAHLALEGSAPMFAVPALAAPDALAVMAYVALGLLCGLAGVGITKLTYAIEDGFERLPIHWMWWPALGGIAVGLIGWWMPLTLGVGYDNIAGAITGHLAVSTLLALCAAKLLSWSIALGSGTSGGTLAPLFTIGSALGGVLGAVLAAQAPWLHVDPHMAALVCMAAVFAGASRAFLTSVLFAFETTQQPHALLPLLGACAAAYLVSGLSMRHTIMTEKIARRGVRVPSDYAADFLDQIAAGDACSREVVTLRSDESLRAVRARIASGDAAFKHQGFPVLDAVGHPIGMLTRRDLLDPQHHDDLRLAALLSRPLLAVREDHSLREAADHMVEAEVGRLVVLGRNAPHGMVGILTRGDLLAAHAQRLRQARDAQHRRRGVSADTAR